MNWPGYKLDDLGPSTQMGKVMRDLARRRPNRASRLLDALDDFSQQPLSAAQLVAPVAGNPSGQEVYLVPQQYVFHSTSDSAAVVLVDHLAEEVRFLEIWEDYGGGPKAATDWQQVRTMAVSIVGP